MNNFTFGNESGLNYYETICGGTGAGPDHPGCDAVHSHMTNTRYVHCRHHFSCCGFLYYAHQWKYRKM